MVRCSSQAVGWQCSISAGPLAASHPAGQPLRPASPIPGCPPAGCRRHAAPAPAQRRAAHAAAPWQGTPAPTAHGGRRPPHTCAPAHSASGVRALATASERPRSCRLMAWPRTGCRMQLVHAAAPPPPAHLGSPSSKSAGRPRSQGKPPGPPCHQLPHLACFSFRFLAAAPPTGPRVGGLLPAGCCRAVAAAAGCPACLAWPPPPSALCCCCAGYQRCHTCRGDSESRRFHRAGCLRRVTTAQVGPCCKAGPRTGASRSRGAPGKKAPRHARPHPPTSAKCTPPAPACSRPGSARQSRRTPPAAAAAAWQRRGHHLPAACPC